MRNKNVIFSKLILYLISKITTFIMHYSSINQISFYFFCNIFYFCFFFLNFYVIIFTLYRILLYFFIILCNLAWKFDFNLYTFLCIIIIKKLRNDRIRDNMSSRTLDWTTFSSFVIGRLYI